MKYRRIDAEAVVQRERRDFVRPLKLKKVCLKSNEIEESLPYEKHRVARLHRLRMLSIPCPYTSDRVVATVSGKLY